MRAQGCTLHVGNRVFGGRLCILLFCVWESGLWHRVCPIPASPRHHIASAAAYIFICICRGGTECVRTQGRMLHVGNRVFGVQLCILFSVCGIVACGTVCAPSPPPPALISPAQQRAYLYVFAEVEWGACEHRGACCTSATMFLVGSCVFYLFYWGSGLSHRVRPMPASSRLHVDSAAACSFVCICRGGAGRVWA